jgi:hypothetical protein
MKVMPVVLRASRAPLAVDCHHPSIRAALDGHGILAVNVLVLGSPGSRATPNKLLLHTKAFKKEQQDATSNYRKNQVKP